MDAFISKQSGFSKVRRGQKLDIPSLPALNEMAKTMEGVQNHSAGDIARVGEPLNPDFLRWIPEFRAQFRKTDGSLVFPLRPGEIHGFPADYAAVFPEVTEILAASFGIGEPHQSLQAVAGRAALDHMFLALKVRADDALRKGKRPVLIMDPMAWSGYEPLADNLDIDLLYMPAQRGMGLKASGEGLRQALEYAAAEGFYPIGALPILPSNPTGVGLSREELAGYIQTAAEANLPVLIDAFYSPLDPEGHQVAVPMNYLEGVLAPEVLKYVGLLVGETKVTNSQDKTATVFWEAPRGHEKLAGQLLAVARSRMMATNTYPKYGDALVAAALHSFPGGIHAAMGSRYTKLQEARLATRTLCQRLDLPCSVGGSFYATIALVDADGRSLIRDADGEVIIDPRKAIEALLRDHKLIAAPGMSFRPAEESVPLIRVSAATDRAGIFALGEIFERLKAA